MQGTWCPLFPDWGWGQSKAWGRKNLAPTPKAELGYDTQFGSRETWRHGEKKTGGGNRQGPPGPLRRGEEV